jgi:YD repeat-containing protein
MVAIVNGQGLGVNSGSAGVLGNRGSGGQAQVGQNGQKIYLNASNGNLVVQNQDERLFDHGLGLGVLRTYNSQGRLHDDNGDNWLTGFYAKRVALTGAAGAAGSFVTLTGQDGSETAYPWDAQAGLYSYARGEGAPDSIVIGGGQLTWTDGGTGLVEVYDAASGRIDASIDPSGHRIDYLYTVGGMLASATSDTGEAVDYDYSGSNLAQVRTVTQDAAGTWHEQVKVRYEYDGADRLSAVVVDLSPEDGQVADGNVYRTEYGYDGASRRLASISQSDGTALAFSYVEQDGEYLLATMIDAAQATFTFAYDRAAGQTTITDPLAAVTVLHYDSQDRLIRVDQPASGGALATAAFDYDGNGNLASVTDPLDHVTSYEYDADGNRTVVRDAAGNTVVSAYNAAGQLSSETATLSGLPQTVRYYYEAASSSGAAGPVRYIVSAEGRVTEYRYDANGERISTLAYARATLDAALLTGAETAAEIGARVVLALAGAAATGLTRTDVQRIDTAYDAHGQVANITRYTAVLSAGLAGVPAGRRVTTYVYDQAGSLLSTIDPAGNQTAYTYDGLGRVLAVAGDQGGITTTQYDAGGSRITVHYAGGSVTSVYDRAGRLVSVTQAGGAGACVNYYDADGRVRMTQDALGNRSFALYDGAGAQAGAVAADGTLTEYSYDRAGQLARTVVHATPIDTATLVDADGAPLALTLDQIRPAVNPADQATWQVHDNAIRLAYVISASGVVTETQYDSKSQAVATIVYAQLLDVLSLPVVMTVADLNLTRDATRDQVTRQYFEADGNHTGTLDAQGRLTQYLYDGAANLVETRGYARQVNAALGATDTLARLTANLRSINDARTLYTVDATGARTGVQQVQGYPDDVLPGVNDIRGTILQPGEQDDYQFTLTQDSKFFFDGIQGDGMQWSLSEAG